MHGSWKHHHLYVVPSHPRHGKPETHLQPSVKQRDGEIDGSVGRVFASQHEDLNFILRTHVKKKWGVVACAYNPITEEVEIGGSLAS